MRGKLFVEQAPKRVDAINGEIQVFCLVFPRRDSVIVPKITVGGFEERDAASRESDAFGARSIQNRARRDAPYVNSPTRGIDGTERFCTAIAFAKYLRERFGHTMRLGVLSEILSGSLSSFS